jgi:hypothetical protein
MLLLITALSCAVTHSVAAAKDERPSPHVNRSPGGILRADLGLFLKELGTVVATTDHVFINIAAEVPSMNLTMPIEGHLNCMTAMLPIKEQTKEQTFDCHEINGVYQDYKRLLNATKENIQRDLAEVEESLQGRYRIMISDRPKRLAILPLIWGVASAAFGISGAIFAHQRRESLKGSVKQLYSNYDNLKEQHLLLEDRTITALKETSNALDTIKNGSKEPTMH